MVQLIFTVVVDSLSVGFFLWFWNHILTKSILTIVNYNSKYLHTEGEWFAYA